jgi:hypothetical protein
MTFQIRPARRDNAKLLIGLAGPTGSGKTYSAILLASGIIDVTGGKIVGIDTESGRMLQYAPPGDDAFVFDYLELHAPFRPDRYQEAFELAEQHAGPGGVVVVDSMSHEHEGPGGILEWHDEEVDRLVNASRYENTNRERFNFPAWSVPKAARRRLINRVLQSRCHVIFCFRAKEKNVLVDKQNGRGKEIVNIGWSPITGDEWPYEMTIFALLSGEKKGTPIIDGFSYGKLPLNMRSLVSTEVALTADTGRKLAKWAGNGHARQADISPARPDSSEPKPNGKAKSAAAATSERPAAKPGRMIRVWYSDQFENDVPQPDALDALKAAIAGARTQRALEDVRRNNNWVPVKFEEEVNEWFQHRADSIGDAPDDAPTNAGAFDDLEDPEWSEGAQAKQADWVEEKA